MKNTKTVKIYLDDIRQTPKGYIRTYSVNQTIRLIEKLEREEAQIELIDLDHDLGDYAYDGGDGIKILDWLIERGTLYPINIHTMNVVARQNMERLINRYWDTNY